jgi:hypothetical protein
VPGGASGVLPATRSDILKGTNFRSKVIYLFIGLSGKRLLLENTHSKNGSSNKGRPPDREETLHKELGQLRRLGRRSFKKVKRLRPRQRRGFFIFCLFADANQRSGDRNFRVASLSIAACFIFMRIRYRSSRSDPWISIIVSPSFTAASANDIIAPCVQFSPSLSLSASPWQHR